MMLADLINTIIPRRKDSMLQRLYKIKYVFVLLVLLALPMLVMPSTGNAGVAADGRGVGQRTLDQTDMGDFRLVYFVDRREGETLVQVTNTSTRGINIHVQLFDVNNDFQVCEECNFPDMLTPEDTHVYDVAEMITNSGPGLPPASTQCELDDGHYGFVVITFDSYKDALGVCGNGFDDCFVEGGPLIGMFRVIRDSGYEYRTNAAGKEVLRNGTKRVIAEEELIAGSGRRSIDSLINFQLADGNQFADVVGITFWEKDSVRVDADPLVGTAFGFFEDILIWTENEFPGSCSETVFACAPNNLDRGIDNSLPNNFEANRICSTERLEANTSGWLHMPFEGFFCAPPIGDINNFCPPSIEENAFFVGFVGLNNGDGTGSMDSWWSQRPERRGHGGPAMQLP